MQARPADEETHRVLRSILERIREPIVEPILHPSQGRIRALALSIVVGHPVFFLVWAHGLPQPYECLWQQLVLSGLLTNAVIPGVIWLSVPFFFSWMYFCNGRNDIGFAAMASLFLICHHATDWRLATPGVAIGLLSAWGLFLALGPQVPQMPDDTVWAHAVVMGFSGFMGLTLDLSASNLRRAQLKQALGTMGIMAYELRTSLATVTLIGDALRNEVPQAHPRTAAALEQFSTRLHAVVRNMNKQIDMQISNAQLMSLPVAHEPLSAAQVVRTAVAAYPYRHARERACVQVEVLFIQVDDNLTQSALHALAGNAKPNRPGDLTLTVQSRVHRPALAAAETTALTS